MKSTTDFGEAEVWVMLGESGPISLRKVMLLVLVSYIGHPSAGKMTRPGISGSLDSPLGVLGCLDRNIQPSLPVLAPGVAGSVHP